MVVQALDHLRQIWGIMLMVVLGLDHHQRLYLVEQFHDFVVGKTCHPCELVGIG